MKKIFSTIAAVITLLCVLVLAGCGHEHEWGEWKTVKEATCTAEGTMERVCECGEKETQACATIPHKYSGKWETEVLPTCEEDGIASQECVRCGEKKTQPVPKGGHLADERIDVPATCVSEGAQTIFCVRCEKIMDEESIPATGLHSEGEWIVDTEPTCTKEGSKHQVCSTCNENIKNESIAATGHNYTETVTKATTGSKASVKYDCSVCGESHIEEFGQISVSAALTGSGMTMTGGGMYYTRSFTVTASGGYGKYQYKFESGSNILQDFSTSNEIEIYGNIFVDSATVTITVMDEAGQKTVYEIKGNGSFVDSYVIYE